MQQKNTKVYLPTTYEQFLQQKKKIVKPGSNPSNVKNDTLFKDTEIKQPQEPKQNLDNFRKITEKPESITDENQMPSKSVTINEKIVHSDFKRMFDDFHNNRFDSIKDKINGELKRLKESPPIEVPSVSQILNQMEIQSLDNIETIRDEFKITAGKRNIDKLQKMLCFNKFFLILNKEKRWKIFDNSHFEEFEPGEKVYQEGDADQFMYVIIKGCVKQYEKKLTTYNEKIMVNFTSHYEGSNFGEVSGYGENQVKGKRYHTIETIEKCYVLKLSNSFYRDLISNAAEDDFDKKLNALMESTIFRETSKLMVTPLMSTLEKHILPYGKVLIRQDEDVKKLFFVAEGNLKVIFLDRAKRNVRHLNIEEKPDNISINRPKTREKAKSKQKNYSIHNTFYYPQTEDSTKEFIYGKKRMVGEEIEYNDQVVFCELRIGDFFGGKSFLSNVEKDKKVEKSKYFQSSLKARLSIISSSTQSLVYSIDQKKFFSLSENLQRLISKGIMDEAYFDEYNIEDKLGGHREWKKFSQKMVETVIKGKKQRSHSFRH